MGNTAELAAVLSRIVELIDRDDVDTGWSRYEAHDLRAEIGSFLQKVDAGLQLDDMERGHLRFLFAPTGALQETSISSGWADEFLVLSARFDASQSDSG